jgi:hypothetical protein
MSTVGYQCISNSIKNETNVFNKQNSKHSLKTPVIPHEWLF